MASETEICNIAISHLGNGKEIANLDTEKSEEARACRTYFDTARNSTLRDYAWPFATRIVSLGLVETNPNNEWIYSYRYPSDCIHIRKIQSGIRNDTRQSVIPYRIASDDVGRLIFTDDQDAIMEYTAKITDPQLYPSDFIMAFSYRLAVYIAPRLTGGDPFKIQRELQQNYTFEMSLARQGAQSEQQDEEPPDSEFIRARE